MPRSGWGTYFDRMINYDTPKGAVDQLGQIIDNIKNRSKIHGSSFVMVIPQPHKDINKLMGAPCLNYITIQVEKNKSAKNQRIINMLAVYRNHDFTERAYGNYMGLCDLLKYISIESNSSCGCLTCISSHAYVPNYKTELIKLSDKILRGNHE